MVWVKDSSFKHKFEMSKNGIKDVNVLLEKFKKSKTPIQEAETELRKLYNKKDYDRGITLYNSLDINYRLWGKINMSWPNSNTFGPRYEVLHPITNKPVNIPDRGWRWKKDTFDKAINLEQITKLHDGTYICGRIWFDKDEHTQPSSILFLDDVESLLLRSIISLKSDGGIEVEELFDGKSYFSYPKPISLIKILIDSLTLNNNDIILDFFSGSATTAHATLELNKDDCGNRKFIMVQMPEECEESSEAFKAGYKNIADIGKERIRRVIKKIKKEQEGKLDLDGTNGKQDLGFKVFKLQESNFKIWRTDIKTEAELTEQIELHIEPLAENANIENVLYELLLKSGVPLTAKIEEKDGYYLVDDNEIAIILETVNTDIIKSVIAKNPRKVITLDHLFNKNDQLKTNTALQMKDAGIEFKVV